MQTSVIKCNKLNITIEGKGLIECTGEIVQTEFGNLYISIDLPFLIESLDAFPDNQVIDGETEDGDLVNADGCYKFSLVASGAFPPAIVRFTPMEVDVTTSLPDSRWDRMDAYLKSPIFPEGSEEIIDGTRRLRIFPSQRSINVIEKGKLTTKLTIQENTLVSYDCEEYFQEYILLLSVSQRSKLFAPRRELWNGDRLVKIQLFPNDMPTQTSHQVIPVDRASISAFMRNSIPNFRTKKADYDLMRLAEYYCMAFEATYIEQRFLYASVFMEAFKFFWGKNLSGLRIVYTGSGSIKGYADHSSPGKELSFKTLLDRAAISVGCNADFTFIDERNAMFHSGSPRSVHAGAPHSYPSLRPHTWKMYRQMDDILLRIMGFTGNIIPYHAVDTVEAFPSAVVI